MVKQLKKGRDRLKTAYWSLVGMACAMLISLQPVMADTIWDNYEKTSGKKKGGVGSEEKMA